jgi:hypothetical protein
LIIAGPVADSPVLPQLWFWDGNDCFPGKREASDPPMGKVVRFGAIPTPRGAKPEAIVVLKEYPDAKSYDVIVLYDGPKGGNPQKFRAVLP